MERFGKPEEMIISQCMNYKIDSKYQAQYIRYTYPPLRGYLIVKYFKEKVVMLVRKLDNAIS
jgi:hypothetical protein